VPIVVLVGTEEELKNGKGRVGLSAEAAASRLNIGGRGFRKLVANGEISPYEERLGPLTFYEEPDVEKLRQTRLRRY